MPLVVGGEIDDGIGLFYCIVGIMALLAVSCLLALSYNYQANAGQIGNTNDGNEVSEVAGGCDDEQRSEFDVMERGEVGASHTNQGAPSESQPKKLTKKTHSIAHADITEKNIVCAH